MPRSRDIKTNFASGVIAPDGIARDDLPLYNNALLSGQNIVVQSMGGITRRQGTLFMKDYGTQEMVRVLPFMFNRDQKYLIVFTVDEIDIFRDGVSVSTLTSPFTTPSQIRELGFAQSADVMVLSHSDVAPQILRRLGDDSTWDVIPAPIINPPQFNCDEEEPPVCEDLWTEENGYPQRCTFHQGRLWFANTNKRPQSVWASKAQDFFNFDLGDGSAGDSIQETLDTDFINPILNIYSMGALQVFTLGAEFINSAEVITPTTSAWSRQTDYGSTPFVNPVSIDGATLYLDGSGRTIRNFVYSDKVNGFDAPSISLMAENLIRKPIKLGSMRGDALEASSYVYAVNIDGSMAVCNLAKAQQMIAWTEWTTQGSYKDVINLDKELYVLVQRLAPPKGEFVTHNGETVTHKGEPVWIGDNPDVLATHWMLERVSQLSLTDCGSINHSLSESSTEYFRKDDNNFFGAYLAPDQRGYTVIVEDGKIVHRTAYLKNEPTDNFISVQNEVYRAVNSFNNDESVREKYFDAEVGFSWLMYSVGKTQRVDNGKNYIDGLAHLLGMSVTCNLDGNVFPNETVVSGDTVATVERTYPDGIDWIFDDNNYILRVQTAEGFVVMGAYDGVLYENLSETDYGYLISGAEGDADSEYLQLGNVVDTSYGGNVQIDYDEISGTNIDTVTGEDGVFVFTPPKGVNLVNICMAGGGGSGTFYVNEDVPIGGGLAGETINQDLEVSSKIPMDIVIGNVSGAYTKGNPTSIDDIVADGGGHGDAFKYYGNGALGAEGCGGVFRDGSANVIGKPPMWGGQAGAFGNGGNGGGVQSGQVSAGGGAQARGGAGRLIISWKDSILYTHKTRKMKLLATTVEDGLVSFPDTPYAVGEAGLSYRVFAQTTLLAPNAGAGSLMNEPKRIVSINARFKDTQGVNVQGFDIPERQFGEDVLDTSVPLLTGSTKLRLLGYNRETKVTIFQNDPMPFTLLGLDIEINY